MNIFYLANNAYALLLAVFGVGLVIFIHELGHFVFCKLFGINVPTFSIGFGPVLFKKNLFKTDFIVSAFPFGGYVEPEDGNQPGGIGHANLLQRIVMLSAGIMFNLLSAIIIYASIAFFSGMPSEELSSLEVRSVSENALVRDKIFAGDKIVGDHKGLFSSGKATYESFRNNLIQNKGKPFSLIVEQDGGKTNSIIFEIPANAPDTGILGVSLLPNHKDGVTNVKSAEEALHYGWNKFLSIVNIITTGISNCCSLKKFSESLGGPLKTISESMQMARKSLIEFFLFVAYFSINIGLLNVLPIGLLDGGKILIALLEGILGRSIDRFASILYLVSGLILGGVMIGLTLKEGKALIMSLLKIT